MIARLIVLLIYIAATVMIFAGRASTETMPTSNPAAFVRSLLDKPENELDFTQAKLAIDAFADPSIDVDAIGAEIDLMVETVEKMIATLPPEAAATSLERMRALRAFLYEPGWWNDNKPFQYDLDDPYGQQAGAQFLTTYLRTRKGNCVSMPILFLALAQRIGLEVTLSTAPLHLFIKWTDAESGKTWNLEATSGAGFTRDEHYRKLMPMTDEAVANGVYLKTLSRRETLGVMASLVLDDLLQEENYEDAIRVADVLLEVNPADSYALVKKGTAYYRLLERDIIRKYPKESDIPLTEMPRAIELSRSNQEAFAKAEALGWREPKFD